MPRLSVRIHVLSIGGHSFLDGHECFHFSHLGRWAVVECSRGRPAGLPRRLYTRRLRRFAVARGHGMGAEGGIVNLSEIAKPFGDEAEAWEQTEALKPATQ